MAALNKFVLIHQIFAGLGVFISVGQISLCDCLCIRDQQHNFAFVPIQCLHLHLHLPYYKHSLSTRLICSDSVRFVKVLSVSAHGPHS